MAWDVRDNPCTSSKGIPKKRWATQNAAIFVARWASRNDGKRRRTYFCPACSKWHVTSQGPFRDPPSTMSA